MNSRHLFLSSLAATTIVGFAQSQTVRATQLIDATPGVINFDPAVASSGNLSVAGFSENDHVYVVTSDGTGKTWSTAQIQVDGDPGANRKDVNQDDIQIIGDRVFMLWNDRRIGDPAREAYLGRSLDGGATWTEASVFAQAAPSQARDWKLGVSDGGAAGLDTVVVAVTHDADGLSNEIFMVGSSFDGGATFNPTTSPVQGFASGAFDIDGFDMIVDGLTIHIVWADDRNGTNDVWYQQSADGGFSWLGADVQLNTATGQNDLIDLDLNGGTLAVAWKTGPASGGPNDVHAAVSTDGGATWGADVTISATGVQVGSFGEAAKCRVTDSGNVVVAWDQGPDFATDIGYSTSTDSGATFAAPTILPNGGFPTMDSGNEYVVILSNDQGPGADPLSAIVSDDEGLTFSAQFDVADNTGDIDRGRIVFNALYDNAVCVWHADDVGSNDTYGGGFRPQTITSIGWQDLYTAPTLGFDASDWGSNGVTFIVLASGTGPSAIPDGRFECLSPDFINTLGAFFTVFTVAGDGSTGVFGNPFMGQPFIIDGATPIYFAGVGFGGIPAAEARFSETQFFNI